VRHVEDIPFERIRPAKATAQEKKVTDMQVGFWVPLLQGLGVCSYLVCRVQGLDGWVQGLRGYHCLRGYHYEGQHNICVSTFVKCVRLGLQAALQPQAAFAFVTSTLIDGLCCICNAVSVLTSIVAHVLLCAVLTDIAVSVLLYDILTSIVAYVLLYAVRTDVAVFELLFDALTHIAACVLLYAVLQAALQTADKQTIVGSLKDMLYKRRMERSLLRAKGEWEAWALLVFGTGFRACVVGRQAAVHGALPAARKWQVLSGLRAGPVLLGPCIVFKAVAYSCRHSISPSKVPPPSHQWPP
jgi:hypothetical protein